MDLKKLMPKFGKKNDEATDGGEQAAIEEWIKENGPLQMRNVTRGNRLHRRAQLAQTRKANRRYRRAVMKRNFDISTAKAQDRVLKGAGSEAMQRNVRRHMENIQAAMAKAEAKAQAATA